MISYEFNGIRLRLTDDGALTLIGNGERIDLSAEATFAMALFLGLPGTRPRINTAFVKRQKDEGEEE
jgi:hypothetical protein